MLVLALPAEERGIPSLGASIELLHTLFSNQDQLSARIRRDVSGHHLQVVRMPFVCIPPASPSYYRKFRRTSIFGIGVLELSHV